MRRATAEPIIASDADGERGSASVEAAVADGERGSASVEAALAVCALVAVLAMALAGIAVMIAQLRCVDAAREAARLVARGEPERAEQAARQVAPGGARIAVRVDADEVTVEVSAEPAGGALPAITVRAEAMAVLEPGVAGSP
jgi:Flp pilus assembly protein TadG